jgi:hypothetical protein
MNSRCQTTNCVQLSVPQPSTTRPDAVGSTLSLFLARNFSQKPYIAKACRQSGNLSVPPLLTFAHDYSPLLIFKKIIFFAHEPGWPTMQHSISIHHPLQFAA